MKFLRILSFILIAFVGFKASAMEDTVAISEEVLLDCVETPLADGFYKNKVPKDIKKLLIYETLAGLPISSVFKRIGELRKVCKEWNTLLYDPLVLKKIFSSCSYSSDIVKYPIARTYLDLYIASVLAKEQHTEREKDFIKKLIQSDSLSSEELLHELIAGPEVTQKTLSQDLPLLKCAMALVLALNKTAREKYGWKLMPLLRSVSQDSLSDLLNIVTESLQYYPEDERKDMKIQIYSFLQNDEIQEKQPLSCENLVILLNGYTSCLTQCKNVITLDSQSFYELITRAFFVNKELDELFKAIVKGNTKYLESAFLQDHATLHIALILALKSDTTEYVKIIVKQMVEKKASTDGAKGFTVIFLSLLEVVKHSPEEHYEQLSRSLIAAISVKARRPPLALIFQLVHTKQDLARVCTVWNLIREKFPSNGEIPSDFLQACLDQDLEEIRINLSKVKQDPSPCIVALIICSINSLDKARKALLKDPLIKGMYAMLTSSQSPLSMLLSSTETSDEEKTYSLPELSIRLDFLKQEACEDDYVNPKWVYHFINNLSLSEKDMTFIKDLHECEIDKATLSTLSPSVLELALLKALSTNAIKRAKELIKHLPRYNAKSIEQAIQTELVKWMLHLAEHLNLEEITTELNHLKDNSSGANDNLE